MKHLNFKIKAISLLLLASPISSFTYADIQLGQDANDISVRVNADDGSMGAFIVNNGLINSTVTFSSSLYNTTITAGSSSISVDAFSGIELSNAKLSGLQTGALSSSSTDAVTGAQLYKTNSDVVTNTNDIATNKASITTNTNDIVTNKANITTNTNDIATNKANIATNSAAIALNTTDIFNLRSDMNSKFENIDHKLDSQKNEYRTGIASLAAMSNIPNVNGHTFSAGFGVGQFRDQSAIAAGANWNINENFASKMSIGFSGSDFTGGAGIAFGF
jgi:autotransporter adhesin